MGAHNVCLYKEADKKYTGCNPKTIELLDCVLVGVCVVIRLNMVEHLTLKCELLFWSAVLKQQPMENVKIPQLYNSIQAGIQSKNHVG